MSEYWKSTPKYWCKHCTIYVKDTPFERKQHEQTGKHQGNLRRFLRGIQNDHERDEREKQKAKAEVDRLNRVVGGTSLSAPAPPIVRKGPTATPSAADQKRQWSQLAEMGIKVPDEVRGEMAMVGDWKAVSSQHALQSETPEESLSVGVRKRKHEGQEEEEEEEKEAGETVMRRGWGSTTRSYPGHDTADLDALLSSSIPLKRPKCEPTGDLESLRVKQEEIKASAEAEAPETKPLTLDEGSMPQVKIEPDTRSEDQGEDGDSIKLRKAEDSQTATKHGGKTDTAPVPLFKKRKAKVITR